MNNPETKMGVLGGLSFCLIGQIHNSIYQSVLLAAIGAGVSFLVSRFLQWLFKNPD
ncbi:hypothetical protein G6M26_41705 [Agrobacterium tumefaciens]|nr:hypothetical protein [Agrobacterium tumefaciens]NTE25064.1 hypothetical protein [Agrobacterium tumefaciens]